MMPALPGEFKQCKDLLTATAPAMLSRGFGIDVHKYATAAVAQAHPARIIPLVRLYQLCTSRAMVGAGNDSIRAASRATRTRAFWLAVVRAQAAFTCMAGTGASIANAVHGGVLREKTGRCLRAARKPAVCGIGGFAGGKPAIA